MSPDDENEITGKNQTKKILGVVLVLIVLIAGKHWVTGSKQRERDRRVERSMAAVDDKNEVIRAAAEKMMKADCRSGKGMAYAGDMKKVASVNAKKKDWCMCLAGGFTGYATVEHGANTPMPTRKELKSFLIKSKSSYLKAKETAEEVLNCLEYYRVNPNTK